LTGFETACSAKPGDHFPASFYKNLQRFSSKELTPEKMTAPELNELECENGVFAPTLDVFALGALLQRLRAYPVNPRPLGAGAKDEERDEEMWKDWRQDPWECFVYHCLAREPNRRFQSITQCATFFERYAGRNTYSPMIPPELVPLEDGLSITRFPVMNFEFECFCRDSRRMQPTRGLSFQYCGPFAPVVNVNLRDATDYCKWLTTRNSADGNWRLPTKAEWLRAATGTSPQGFPFPWGNEPPTRERANYFGEFRGPTVVGSNSAGSSQNGCHDLAGNVWEWCQDRLPGEPKRVLKGGSFGSPSVDLNLAVERTRLFSGRYNDAGFRLIKEEK
jgi:serine/threonine-protein kinase